MRRWVAAVVIAAAAGFAAYELFVLEDYRVMAVSPSPDGAFEAVEVMGFRLLDEEWSVWIRERGERGLGTRVTEWATSGTAMRWSGDRRLFVRGQPRSRTFLLVEEFDGVTLVSGG